MHDHMAEVDEPFLFARRGTTFFTIARAKAILLDLPNTSLVFLDGSHFLLETHGSKATWHIRRFLEGALAT